MRSALAPLVLIVFLAVPFRATAEGCAQQSSDADLDPSGVVDVFAGNGDDCSSAAPEARDGTYPYTIKNVVDAPLTFEGCPVGEVYAALEVLTIRFPGDPGAFVRNDLECVPYTSLDPSLTVPPSSGAVWDVVREQLPLPAVRLSPGEKGLVGIETWFWADPAADGLTQVDNDGDPSTPPRWGLTLTASVVGVSTTATVWIDEYRWQVDDDLVLTAPTPGSEPDPAATHTYARKGPRQLLASTVWRGTWESPIGGGTLGPAELVGGPLGYHVHEVRAVPADH